MSLPKINLQKIRRIALVRNDRLGDLVCTLPAFEALRQGLPGAHITAVVNRYVAPLLNQHPHVDEVLFDSFQDPEEQLTSLLRAGRFDAVLVVHDTKRNCQAAKKAGVPIRVTYGQNWQSARCGTHRCPKVKKHSIIHEANHALSFTKRLGIPLTLEQARPTIHVDPIERDRIQKLIVSRLGSDGPLFGIHPGSSGSAFNWPADCYFETIRRIAPHGRVIFSGGTSGGRFDEAFDWIKSQLTPELSKRVLPLPDLNMPQLIAALSLLDVYLGSSTGPLHIASIVARHAVGLLSDIIPQHPLRWSPIGPNVNVLAATWNHFEILPNESPLVERHMTQITIDMVVERVLNPVRRSLAA